VSSLATGFALAKERVTDLISDLSDRILGTDSRLSDARPPVAGSVTSSSLATAFTLAAGKITGALADSNIPTLAKSKITDLISDLSARVLGTDSRLSDARTPLAGSVVVSSLATGFALAKEKVTDLISDLSDRILGTDSRLSDARAPLTGSVVVASLATGFEIAKSKVTDLISDLSDRILGTDSRLSDARPPVAGSVTTNSLASAFALAKEKVTDLVTDLSNRVLGSDSRLSDARAPLTGSVTAGSLATAFTLAASKVSGALAASNIPSLDASKITAGTFNLSRIPSIITSKLAVGDMTNSVLDGGFERGLYGPVAPFSYDATTFKFGTKSMKIDESLGASYSVMTLHTTEIEIEIGDQLYMQQWAYRDAANVVTTLNIQVTWDDGTFSYDYRPASLTPQTSAADKTWIKYSGVMAPATKRGRATIQLKRLSGSAPTGAGAWYFDDIVVRKMTTALTLADGSVSVSSLAAAFALAKDKVTGLITDLADRVLGTDSRLSDARVPVTGSVVAASLATTFALAKDKVTGLLADLSDRILGTDSRLSDARAPLTGSVVVSSLASAFSLAKDKVTDLVADLSNRVLGTDSRLSDARSPLAGSVTAGSLATAFTLAAGKITGALADSNIPALAQSKIVSLVTDLSNRILGTDSRLSDARAPLSGSVVAASLATAFTLAKDKVTDLISDLSERVLGTDSRLSDARTPVAGSVTTLSLASAFALAKDKVTDLVSDLADRVLGSDSRLSDARTPVAGSVTSSSLATAFTLAASKVAGTLADSNIPALAKSKITDLISDLSARVLGTDSRLSDARTPVAGSVTVTSLASAFALAKDKVTDLVSDLSARVLGTDSRLSDARAPLANSVTTATLASNFSLAAAKINGILGIDLIPILTRAKIGAGTIGVNELASTDSQNLVQNGSFEAGLDQWGTNFGTMTASSTKSRSGSQSIKCLGTGELAQNPGIPATPGQIYTLTGWFFNESLTAGGPGGLRLQQRATGGTVWTDAGASTVSNLPVGSWQKQSISYTIPADGSIDRVRVRLAFATTGVAYIDDLELVRAVEADKITGELSSANIPTLAQSKIASLLSDLSARILGTDSRLSDARVPVAGSVTTLSLASAFALAKDKVTDLVSDLSDRILGTDSRLSDARAPLAGSVVAGSLASAFTLAAGKITGALAESNIPTLAQSKIASLVADLTNRVLGTDSRLSDARTPVTGSVIAESLATTFALAKDKVTGLLSDLSERILGTDSRLSDARVPVAGSVTTLSLASAFEIAKSKVTDLVSDLSNRVLGTDSRLSDARTPVAGSVTAGSLATAFTLAAGKITGALADSNIPTLAQSKISSLVTDLSNRILGTDSRLSDARTPVAGSVIAASLASTFALAKEKVTDLVSDLSDRILGTDSRLSDARTPVTGSVTTLSLASAFALAKDKVTDLVSDLSARVLGTDSRLSDARTPVAGSVTTGSLATAFTLAAAKVSGTLADANIPTLAQSKISALVTDLSARILGTDSRLSDARTPLANSVTTNSLASAFALAKDKVTGLISDLSDRILGTDSRLSDARVPVTGSVTTAALAGSFELEKTKVTGLVGELGTITDTADGAANTAVGVANALAQFLSDDKSGSDDNRHLIEQWGGVPNASTLGAAFTQNQPGMVGVIEGCAGAFFGGPLRSHAMHNIPLAGDNQSAKMVFGTNGTLAASTSLFVRAAADMSTFVYVEVFSDEMFLGRGTLSNGVYTLTSWQRRDLKTRKGATVELRATGTLYSVYVNGTPVMSQSDSVGIGANFRRVGMLFHRYSVFGIESIGARVSMFTADDLDIPAKQGVGWAFSRTTVNGSGTTGSGGGVRIIPADTFNVSSASSVTIANTGQGHIVIQKAGWYQMSGKLTFSNVPSSSTGNVGIMQLIGGVWTGIRTGGEFSTYSGTVSTTIYCQVGDTFAMGLINFNSNTVTGHASGAASYFEGSMTTAPRGIQGAQGIQGEQGIQGIQGEKGDTGTGLQITGTVATYAALPTGAADGAQYVVVADDRLYIKTNGAWPAQGAGIVYRGIQGIQGPQGVQGIQGVQGVQGITAWTGTLAEFNALPAATKNAAGWIGVVG
jgi:uncharacterized protein (DUF697 family)